MRATFVISDRVMQKLRAESARSGTPMSALVEHAIIQLLKQAPSGPDAEADPDGLEALHQAMASG